jgi:Spy/CpxP family protein refolding chaperone
LIQRKAADPQRFQDARSTFGKGFSMNSQSARPSLLRLSASLSSALILITMSAPAFASGTGVIDGALNSKPNGVRLAQMGGMGGEMGSKMTGAPMGGDNKPGGMGDKMPCCMGAMGAAPGAGTAMAMPSALPGFPGASHLYHVGSTGFFLDYADKIGLSVEQKASLNGIKQRALTEQSAAERKVAEAEQALWALTAAEQPDAAAIEGKVREIEKLKSDQRLAFIRSVGEAAKLLTAEQRKMVLGMVAMPPDTVMPNMK